MAFIEMIDKKYTLLIDDQRDDLSMDLIARNGLSAISTLERLHGMIDLVYMDHDLGDEHAITGAKIVELALEGNVMPPRVRFVTSNPVGRDAMVSMLEAAGYQMKIVDMQKEWVLVV